MEAVMDFRIRGLDPKPFAPLFALPDAALAGAPRPSQDFGFEAGIPMPRHASRRRTR
jgi:hypothetical protein